MPNYECQKLRQLSFNCCIYVCKGTLMCEKSFLLTRFFRVRYVRLNGLQFLCYRVFDIISALCVTLTGFRESSLIVYFLASCTRVLSFTENSDVVFYDHSHLFYIVGLKPCRKFHIYKLRDYSRF